MPMAFEAVEAVPRPIFMPPTMRKCWGDLLHDVCAGAAHEVAEVYMPFSGERREHFRRKAI